MNPNIQSLNKKFRKITILPLILFGILILIGSSLMIYPSMQDETQDGSSNLAHAMSTICKTQGEGITISKQVPYTKVMKPLIFIISSLITSRKPQTLMRRSSGWMNVFPPLSVISREYAFYKRRQVLLSQKSF